MNNWIQLLFGEGEELTPWQMAMRAFCTVIILLVMLRVSDVRRIFGKKNALDNIMVIMLGAVLARSIVGASPFWSTTAAAATMIGLHRLLTYLALKNTRINRLINGDKVLLYKNGGFISDNLRKSVISKNEIEESLRLEMQNMTLENIDMIFMETNGRLSFIQKKKE
jgi:uncharacterized membrane protein YcaP (DUF421 family)